MEKDAFLKLIIEEVGDNEAVISFDTKFEQLKLWDSLTTMLVITSIKEQFAIELTTQEIKSCVTIEDIYNIATEKQNAK